MPETIIRSLRPVQIVRAGGATRIIERALQGPPGPPGQAAGSSIELTALGDIGGHRVVVADVMGRASYADHTNTDHAGRVVGITLNAAADGGTVYVAILGPVTEPSWAWQSGPIYLGANGLLTQAPPAAGFLQVIATATAADALVVDLKTPVLLI